MTMRTLVSAITLAAALAGHDSRGAAARAHEGDDRLRIVEQLLHDARWDAALGAARELTDALVEDGGGTRGDHRVHADELAGAMAGPNPGGRALAMGRAFALRAVAEAAMGRNDEARWHWYLAQNISTPARAMDVGVFGGAGAFLARHVILPAGAAHRGVVDVIDPERPEGAYGAAFRQPLRTRVTFPSRPRDLRDRDRFSHVVFVRITVDEQGTILQPMVVDAGFYPGLIAKAFDALRQWRYEPATLHGRPVSYRFVVPVPFVDDRPSGTPLASAAPAQDTLRSVSGLAADRRDGTLFVSDERQGVVLRVPANGVARRFAGTGERGFSGDGRPARAAAFNRPRGLSLDPRTGELFVADSDNYRIRVISPDGAAVRTVAGVGLRGIPPRQVPFEPRTPERLAVGRFGGDGGPAARAELNQPAGVCADPAGLLFIADSGNHRIRAVNQGTSPVVVMGVAIEPGHIATVAGTGLLGSGGDGGRAREAQLAFPTELEVDAAGNLIVVDTFNQRIRQIDRQSGIIRTVVEGSLAGLLPARALESWSTSIAGVAVAASQDIVYVDRVAGAVARRSRAGEHALVYHAQRRDLDLRFIELGRDDEIFVGDTRDGRVLRVDGGAARTYVGGSANSLPNLSAANRPSPKRNE